MALVNDLDELDQWFQDMGRTAQITYRIKLSPAYLVRIVRKGPKGPADPVFVQATADSLTLAVERCVEAYYLDQEDGDIAGHIGDMKGKPMV